MFVDKNPLLKTDVILAQFGRSKVERSIAYQRFVRGDDAGPIDWTEVESSSKPIIGDKRFIEQINERLGQKKEEIIEKPLTYISSCLNAPVEVLMNPRGKEERGLRRQGIIILGNKYGVRQIAQLFGMAPSSVFAILNKKREKTT